MSPQMRRDMILDEAITYFADHGFEVQIRQFAREIGISPALVFKYFETKESLVEAVYGSVFEARWNEDWQALLRDRSVPLPDRLIHFYDSYLAKVDDRNWIRIAMRASLDGSDLTRRYLADHVALILSLIADQVDEWFGDHPTGTDEDRRMERVWHLHSTVIYYLIRKHIHMVRVMPDRLTFVTSVISQFLGETASGNARSRRPSA